MTQSLQDQIRSKKAKLAIIESMLQLRDKEGFKELKQAINSFREAVVSELLNADAMTEMARGRAQGINDTCKFLLTLDARADHERKELQKGLTSLQNDLQAVEAGTTAFGKSIDKDDLVTQYAHKDQGR